MLLTNPQTRGFLNEKDPDMNIYSPTKEVYPGLFVDGHDPKYLLVSERTVTSLDERPKQDEIKALGEGEYTLRRIDGQVLRHFRVTTNRNSNLTITSLSPDGLEALSMLNLERLAKQYIRIIKIWPAQVSAARKITAEMNARIDLLKAASPTGTLVSP